MKIEGKICPGRASLARMRFDEPLAAPHAVPAESVLTALGVSPKTGLAEAEASARLARFGPNELQAKPPIPLWQRFASQFNDILVILLLAATAISTGLWLLERDTSVPSEAIAILSIVLLNALMGCIQESRAESAAAALRAMTPSDATVLREGQRSRIPARGLVPGDILCLEAGDAIPADARLLEQSGLQTSEAALTGESLPAAKSVAPIDAGASLGDRSNMLFSGATAISGRCRAIVTATGMRTEIGKIAELLESVPPDATPLQKELNQVGRRLGQAVGVIAILMIATIMTVQRVHGLSAFLDVLILGVALAVAAVPEGLPAIVTAVLALGVQRMARRHAIVRRLAAVETLGSTNVIASDKTGTLTKNEMTVRTVITASGRVQFEGAGYAPTGEVRVTGGGPLSGPLRLELHKALTAADRANNSLLRECNGKWQVQGDPTEGALIVAARKAGLDGPALDARFPRLAEVPFSSERKLMSTVHADGEQPERLQVFCKGAPDVLAGRCSYEWAGNEKRRLTDEGRAQILRLNESLAAEALRTLAVAARELPAGSLRPDEVDEELEQDLIFLGLIGMIDPPRDEAREAVAQARRAGIRLIMITGDHPKTAAVIAAELGLAPDQRALTGLELEAISDEALARAVEETSVYARVNPSHKLHIVKALQSRGAIVAMTGDGVNDAPALKMADIGVAMGLAGTDVAKEAADVVLTDDNFATIVAAVEEGRAIFDNIRKFLRYLLSSNFGEVLTMFFGVLLGRQLGLEARGEELRLPLLATQILFINLVTDGAPALALGIDPPNPGLMSLPPRPRAEGVITARMWRGILLVGLTMAIGTLLVLDACLPGGMIEGAGDLRYAQTMAFTTLVMFQLFNVFNARSDERSAFRGLFRNAWLWLALALSIGLQAAVVYLPALQSAFSTTRLTLRDWGVCAAVASSVLWVREFSKILARCKRRNDPQLRQTSASTSSGKPSLARRP